MGFNVSTSLAGLGALVRAASRWRSRPGRLLSAAKSSSSFAMTLDQPVEVGGDTHVAATKQTAFFLQATW